MVPNGTTQRLLPSAANAAAGATQGDAWRCGRGVAGRMMPLGRRHTPASVVAFVTIVALTSLIMLTLLPSISGLKNDPQYSTIVEIAEDHLARLDPESAVLARTWNPSITRKPLVWEVSWRPQSGTFSEYRRNDLYVTRVRIDRETLVPLAPLFTQQ